MSGTRKRDGRGRLLPADNPDDYTRYVMGDRDPAAMAAKAKRGREDRARASEAAGRSQVAAEDVWKIRVGTTVSERAAAILTERLAELGVSQSDYFRDLMYKDLGIEDTARRPAARRANRTTDKQREEGQQ